VRYCKELELSVRTAQLNLVLLDWAPCKNLQLIWFRLDVILQNSHVLILSEEIAAPKVLKTAFVSFPAT
jgi:hypothetical protein